jgi:hypothetical protein
MWYRHNIKDGDDNKELTNEINNDFLCAYFNYQLRMVNWLEYSLVINEVQRFNSKFTCWSKWGFVDSMSHSFGCDNT